MRLMTRRAIGAFLSVVILVGCAASTNLKQAIGDARLMVTGVARSYETIKALYPADVSQETDRQMLAVLAAAPELLADLQLTADAAAEAADIRGIVSVVDQGLNIIAVIVRATPGLPPDVKLALLAVRTLENVVIALVPKATVAHATAFASDMTADRAREILKR